MKTREAQSIEAKHPISESVRKRNPHLYPESNSVWDKTQNTIEPIVTKPPKRIRQSSKPLMNKLEEEFLEYLILTFGYSRNSIHVQALRFKLGNGIWYKPDLLCMWGDGTTPEAYEIKGPHSFRGGFENLKVAAHQYTAIRWFLVWKENGVWNEQEVLP